MNLGVQAAEGGLTARQDLAKIQLVLEQQYRSTLSGAEAQMKEELYTEMSSNQQGLVRATSRTVSCEHSRPGVFVEFSQT
jgi:hypothetical protein